jgi:hypothetical protein
VRVASFVTLFAASAWASAGQAQEINKIPSLPYVQSIQRQVQELKAVSLPSSVFQYRLPVLENKEQNTLQGTFSPALQIGVGRGSHDLRDSVFLRQSIKWEPGENGSQRTAITIVSPGARGLRLVVRFLDVDPRLRVTALDEAKRVLEVTDGRRIIERSVGATDWKALRNREFLYTTPTAAGESVVLLIEAPTGINVDSVRFSIDWVSHFDRLPFDVQIGQSLSCQRDVACASAADQSAARSVARLVYSDPARGASFLCTGTLLNNKNSDFTPYLLTAAHCINNQVVAETLETYWGYQAPLCGAGALATDWEVKRGGAQLLYTARALDTSLLLLRQSPTRNVSFAGWDAGLQSLRQNTVGIHHPQGDLKKISRGYNAAYVSCGDGDGSSFTCSEASANNGSYHGVVWYEASSEPGSSGSALFRQEGADRFVIGVLRGGSGPSCSGAVSVYGRFDLAFHAGLKNWLASDASAVPRIPIYRFYNEATNAHFYTSSAAERNYVIATYPTYKYEGISFYAYATRQPGTGEVYRFYNTESKAHFYTISAGERDFVIGNYKSFLYEGPAWFGGVTESTTTVPLYRFYNTATGAHFYTTSADERDFVKANYPSYIYEGVAYSVWRSER